jgi:hypothetical protein
VTTNRPPLAGTALTWTGGRGWHLVGVGVTPGVGVVVGIGVEVGVVASVGPNVGVNVGVAVGGKSSLMIVPIPCDRPSIAFVGPDSVTANVWSGSIVLSPTTPTAIVPAESPGAMVKVLVLTW